VAQGVGLANLVEDLVFTQDGALEATGDVDEVSGRARCVPWALTGERCCR